MRLRKLLAGAGRAVLGVVGLAALVGAAFAALGGLGSGVGAQGPGGPEGVELRLSLVDDSDGVVRAGSTISVAAELRLEPWEEALSLSSGSVWLYGASRAQGAHVWEADGRPRLTLSDQTLLSPPEQSDEITAYTTGPTVPLGDAQLLRVLAWDGDTIVARAGSGENAADAAIKYSDNSIYVFSASTGAQVGRVGNTGPLTSSNIPCSFPYPPGSCSRDDDRHWGWGRANDDNTGSAVAVWREDEDTTWLFVGANRHQWYDGNYTYTHVGALYIYELDYSGASVAITRRREVRMPYIAEALSKGTWNGQGDDDMTRYGAAVAVSADGSTLAVGARRMHDVGAVYVYTRPSGGWGAALGWNDAVRVSPVVIPAWGDAGNERPFEPESSTDGPGGSECDAYCRSVSSYVGDVDDRNTAGHADFGAYVALSADGGVLAVSAPAKRFASDRTAGAGRFRGGASLPRQGELLVFLEPAGGWSSVPNYKTGRTEIRQPDSAANFDETMHYQPGPNKRVNAPDWSFSFDWSDTQNHWLGERLALSQDGTTLAASDRHNDAVQIFQVSSPSGWASGPTAPSATLTGAEDGGRWGGFGFNVDGGRLALGDPTYDSPAGVSNQGRVLLFDRPGDGTWESATADEAEELLPPTTPTNRQVTNERYGRSLVWQLNTGNLALAVGAGEAASPGGRLSNIVGPGRLWTLETPVTCPINERTDEGGETTRTTVCSVALGDTRVVIPRGTPDGTFSIAGTVTLAYGDGQTLERTARLEVEVGDVQEVASAKLDFAVDDRGTPNDLRDDRPHRSTLNARGDSTVLRLQILNEREKASAAGSVASVVATTTAGSLSTTLGNGCRGGGGNACEIDVSALTVSNTANIPLTLTHQGTGGTAQVEVLVVARADGEDYRTEPLAVTLAGAATALSVDAAEGALLNVGTPDSGAARDDRDVLNLTVTARDALGYVVPAPTRGASARITGPDGKSVASDKIAVQWPVGGSVCADPPTATNPGGATSGRYSGAAGTTASAVSGAENNVALCIRDDSLPLAANRWLAWETGDADIPIATGGSWWYMWNGLTREPALTSEGRATARLNVNAEASEPLAAGEYTLELRAGGLTATQSFRVSGGAAALALSEPDGRLALGQRVSVTATVSDSEGNAVSDGTPVVWSATDVGTSTVLVQISADGATRDGSASSVWQVVGSGRSTVRAVAGQAANVRLVDVPAVVVAPPGPEASLSSRVPGLTAWQGEGRTSARALLAGLEGVSGLLLWTPGGWLGYALREGSVVPGSFDFEVTAGSVLWLAE